MADDFPDTYETKTTTTTTTTTTTVCTFNEAYIKSLSGLLRIAQIILGLILWILLVCNKCPRGWGYVLSVTLFAWVCTIILFLLILFMVTDRITIINWPVTEFLNNVIWGVLHAVGAILLFVSLFASFCGIFFIIYIFDLLFSVAVTGLYLFQAIHAFQNGVIQFQSQSSGATVQT